MRDKIFEPFTQGTEGLHKGGTGLGLAIAKRQLELMESQLQLESNLGDGSRFFFRIRLPSAKEALVATPPQRKALRRIKIGQVVRALIADDVEENRQVLAALLNQIGALTTCVSNGREALNKAREGGFHVAFLDIRMPEMDGLQAAREIIRE